MLPRRAELSRRTPMPPPTAPMRRTGIRSRSQRPPAAGPTPRSTRAAADSGIPTALRRLVLARDVERCVRCGRHTTAIPRSIQHRQARGMGGRAGAHTATNLILLCGTGITDCHGWVEDRTNWDKASELGWVVSSFAPDPAAVPVLVAWLGWCRAGAEWLQI